MDRHCLGAGGVRAVDDALAGLRWDAPLADALERMARALALCVPVREALAVRFDGGGRTEESALWTADAGASGWNVRHVGTASSLPGAQDKGDKDKGDERDKRDGRDACTAWDARLASPEGGRVVDALSAGREPDPADVRALLGPPLGWTAGVAPGPERPDGKSAGDSPPDALLLPLRRSEGLAGLLAFRLATPGGEGNPSGWSAGAASAARLLAAGLALFCDARTRQERHERRGRALDRALERLRTFIYVTDPRTDEILYMNRAMREAFGVDRPEGRVCWRTLQHGREQRCEFCPVPYLEEHAADGSVYRWQEHNSLTGRMYENYDSLMPWVDGRLAHFQQSVDISDAPRLADAAGRDELTGLPNRREGRERLARALESLERGTDDEGSLAVGLLDVNFLKAVNDEHGHAEGDRVLSLVGRGLREEVREPDFSFRWSGDEFVVVFRRCGRRVAEERLERLRGELAARGEARGLSRPVGFCFGVSEAGPGSGRSVDEVVADADKSMYEQKKQFHIREAERRLAEGESGGAGADTFPRDARLLCRALARSTDSYIYVSDMSSGVFHYSPAMVAEFGLPGEVVANAAAVWGEHVHPDDKAAFLESNQIVTDGRADVHCVEYRARNRQGEWVWVRCRGHVERDEDGRPVLFAGFITNLGQRNAIDPITGLFNKIKLAGDMAALPPGRTAHLMLMGLDGFRHINELYGKRFGDEVLRLAAQRMQVILSGEETLYRLDGDEFGILIQDGRERTDALYRALAESFRQQREYEGKKYFCTFSAGVAAYPEDARDYSELLRCAGSALDASKRSGKNRMTWFRRELLESQQRALELIELLRESMERDYEGFELYYQPQVTADDGRVTGAEALARWTCPKYGPVSPAEFIPLLEQSGLIVPFGRWAFRQAAWQCRRWAEARPDFTVSVNLSYLQATSDDMLTFIRSTLDKLELNPANLVVEFTESCMIEGDAAIHSLFNGLRGLGIRIAMDDFGTGYSSLGMLKTLPADVVKIDRTFVRDILHSRFDETFIRFIVELCHHVGIKVCLEGVERDEERRRVAPLGLDYIQGYLFGRPMSADEFGRTAFSLSPEG